MKVQDVLGQPIRPISKGKPLEHWRWNYRTFLDNLSVPSPRVNHYNPEYGTQSLSRNVWKLPICGAYGPKRGRISLTPRRKSAFTLYWSLMISVGANHHVRHLVQVNPLTPNDPYSGRTAPLTSTHCILYIYSTNTGTEYFKHGVYFPFLSLQNAVYFIILTYVVPVLFTFHI